MTPLASGTVISYPIPAYQNVPIQDYFYKPGRFVITAINLGVFTTITTTLNMNYVIGQQVRLLIPAECGSYQLNETNSFVVEILTDNQVILELDSSKNVDPFIQAQGICKPQILAIGDVNTGSTNYQGNLWNYTTIPGTFKDISPRRNDYGTEAQP